MEAVGSERTVVHSNRGLTVDGCGCENGPAKAVNSSDGNLLVGHGHRSWEAATGVGDGRRGIGPVVAEKHAAVAEVVLVVHALLVERMGWQSDRVRHRAPEAGGVVRWTNVVGVVEGGRRESRRWEGDGKGSCAGSGIYEAVRRWTFEHVRLRVIHAWRSRLAGGLGLGGSSLRLCACTGGDWTRLVRR